MKITFSNLGTIKKTELDLRPLTVIIGPNNTIKTYVAYSVYGIWKAFRENRFLTPYLFSLKGQRAITYGTDKHFYGRVVKHLSDTLARFQHDLAAYFQDTSDKLFSSTTFRVAVTQVEVMEAAKKAAIFVTELSKVPVVIDEDGVRFDASDLRSDQRLHLVSSLSKHVFGALFPHPYLMPAERNAFIITYKMLATRRFRMLRDTQRAIVQRHRFDRSQLDLFPEQGDIRYPTPIEDFLDFLTDVELSHHANGNQKESPIAALARLIEDNIQSRHATRFAPTSLGGHEIKVDINKDLSIDLYNASSSIKQLAPLLLYLRHRARRNDLLIIDEPEMNLHPESQAKLLEALGILVNLGVHVLLTTHSPYFMAHLNNIVGGNMKSPRVRKKQAEALYLGDARAFLPMDKVSAYEMKDGKLCSLKDEDFGIRWDTLSDVSADIQQRFFTIQEAGRKKHGKGQ